MIKKYILTLPGISNKLVESINLMNSVNNIENLEAIDWSTENFIDIENGSKLLIPVFIGKKVNGDYYFSNEDILDEISYLKSQIKFDITFVILSKEDSIYFKTINNFLLDHESSNFHDKILLCSTSHKSLLSTFSNSLILIDDFYTFKDIFASLHENSNKTVNYEFLSLQKLDEINQQIETLRNLPFYFRTNSLIYRIFMPLVLNSRKALEKSKFEFNRLRTKINNYRVKTIYQKNLSPELERFFKIVNSKINPNKILIAPEKKPFLSIIIPVYGKLDYLLRCLYSIGIAETSIKYEVILIDDCGPEKVTKRLGKLKNNLIIHRNDKNIGFTNSCNKGAKLAKGKFLCFLNSDTIVTDQWSDNLLNSFKLAKNVGIAGSRLFYEDASLQEAGGIVFSNGDAANIGKNEPSDSSWFKYFKDVDYVSGASLVISKIDFNKLDGFDQRFTPAYYEDTSLCLDVRHKLNKRVIVNPLSIVIHHEGATNGRDENKGFKKFLPINKEKFIDKHTKDLESYGESYANMWWDRDKYIKSNILILDQCIPTPNEDSGSKDMDNMLRALLNQNYRPHFFALSNRGETPETYGYYEKGVHCVFGKEYINFEDFYKKYHSLFSLVIISRVTSYDEVAKTINKYTPNIKSIFYTVDLHHIRLESEFQNTHNPSVQKLARQIKIKEIHAIKSSTKSVVLSHKEKDYLVNQHNISSQKLLVWPLIRSEFENLNMFKKNKDAKEIIFIGGYRHTPNVEAIKFLEEKIMPELLNIFKENGTSFPGIKLYGSKPTNYIKSLQNNNLRYMGFVKNESDAFVNAKISIAPLPFGSGLKGKTLSSLIYRTPLVGSSYACEGFDNSYPKILVNSSLDPKEFALNIYNTYVYSNEVNYWDDVIHDLEKKYSLNNFMSMMRKDLDDINI